MTPTDWAALAVALATLVGSLAGAVRWMVKNYLQELRPNSGSSLRDSVDRLEERVDRIYEILCDRQP
jgi:hypothetical protein